MAKKQRLKKRTPGRPVAIGVSVTVTIRISEDLDQAIDAWAGQAGIARSEAIRQLIEAGLKRKRGSA
jgi:metal-responsive CopG/Arc/MetJ family transcriptional regulator